MGLKLSGHVVWFAIHCLCLLCLCLVCWAGHKWLRCNRWCKCISVGYFFTVHRPTTCSMFAAKICGTLDYLWSCLCLLCSSGRVGL